jgi:hypothetical protein
MADSIDDIGRRHGFGSEATRSVAEALRRADGRMAQFNHPELGGMGQWSAGGMIMIGDMFNHSLKGRVEALCNDLSGSVEPGSPGTEPGSPQKDWWPADLGHPSASGAQNDMRYACFPDKRRLAVMRDGKTKVYDTGEHRIQGFSQQQGSSQTLTFASQQGSVRLDQLKEV